MITGGLVSVSFRKLTTESIIALVMQAKMRGIEWGGDLHVPHGDVARANEVRKQTENSGLQTAAYGSYYRLNPADLNLPFTAVLDSAVALGAPLIRVWAGGCSSKDADEAHRAGVIEDARRVGTLAAAARIMIGIEYHANTLTDTLESAHRLLREIDHPNVKSLWQPERGLGAVNGVAALRQMLPWLANLHVFHWLADGTREPLSAGAGNWQQYLDVVRSSGRDHWALMEFVRDDLPENFLRDAATLRRLLGSE